MRSSTKQIAAIALTAGALLFYQNCSQAGFGRDQDAYNSLALNYGGTPVCDPLANGSGTASGRRGLIGNLLYVPAAKKPTAELINTITDFIAAAVQADLTLFISELNAPTQKWSSGFKLSDGSLLKDPSTGDPLVEFFGMNLQSVVTLAAADAEGYYQFATVSDDGALLTTGNTILAGSAGKIHSTRVDCGAAPVRLDHAAGLPINYLYYQSPRDEIASVVLWRHVSGPAIPDQVGCNVLNDKGTFFDPNNADGISAMQTVGWRVIPSANYVLPANAPSNACR